MEYGRLRAAVVLVLAVAALGAGAAALDASTSGGGSPGGGEGEGAGLGEGEGGLLPATDPPTGGDGGGGWVAQLLFAAALGGVVFGLVFLAQALVNWSWADLVQFLRTYGGRALAGVVLLGLGYLLVQFFLGFVADGGGGSAGLLGGTEGAGSGTVEDATGVDLPVGALAAVVAVVALAVLLAVRASRGSAAEGPVATDSAAAASGRDPPTDAGRGSAGSADASAVPANNEVYRTWLALADAAGADPRRESPRSVADRAVAAGVDERAVREATALFEAVRYGGAPATDERERRAREVRRALPGGTG